MTLALGVIGRGTQPVEFELEVDECAVHFLAAGAPVSWVPLPHLPMGFMTPDAEGLGGVRGRAEVPPGVLGAISVELRFRPERTRSARSSSACCYLPGDRARRIRGPHRTGGLSRQGLTVYRAVNSLRACDLQDRCRSPVGCGTIRASAELSTDSRICHLVAAVAALIG